MTRWDVCLCSVLLLTTMGLAYGATLQNQRMPKNWQKRCCRGPLPVIWMA